MAFVIDASLVLSWHFPDEKNPQSEAVLRRLRNQTARAPQILWYEIRNVLLIGERRNRAADQATEAFFDFLSTLTIEMAALPDQLAAISLARHHRLSFYDACYLELALREGIALATLDRALAQAAKAEGIPLIGAA